MVFAMPTLNPFISQEKERLRSLVSTMYTEEYPLPSQDLKLLGPFVKCVRSETVEDTTPGKRSIKRIDYFVLNDLGRELYRKWLSGDLDAEFDEAKRRGMRDATPRPRV